MFTGFSIICQCHHGDIIKLWSLLHEGMNPPAYILKDLPACLIRTAI